MSVDAVVLGGGGHVGLTLAIVLSSRGVSTAIYDISKSAMEEIYSGNMPFLGAWGGEASPRGYSG